MKEFLIPFNDIEDISNALGIPIDSRGITSHINNSLSYELISIDPRSSEFQTILQRLYQCHRNLKHYSNFQDYEKYQKWLDQLTNRATSLVSKAMRDLLENSSKICQEYYQKNSKSVDTSNNAKSFEDQPLESAPIYQKFRGLGFRMRE